MTVAEKRLSLHIAIAFAMVYVLWGSTYLAIRVLVANVPAIVMGSLRFLIAGGILLGICAALGKRVLISWREALLLGAIGVLLLTGGNVVVGWAEESLPSGLAALIAAAVPLWVAVIEAFILRLARLSRVGMLGLVVGTCGIVVLLWPQLTAGTTLGHRELIAAAGLLCAAVSWAAGSVLSHHSRLSVDPFVATGWEMFIAGVVNSGIALSLGSYSHAHWTRSALWAIAYLITGGSLLGFTAYIWLLDHVPTAKVATYAYVNPVVAVLLGWVFLREKVDLYVLAGTAIIIAGVVMVTRAKVVRPKPAGHDVKCEAPIYEGTD